MNPGRTNPRWPAALVLGAAVLTLSACRAGGDRSVERANDDLRRRTLDLEEQVTQLRGRNAELAIKLEESERARTSLLPRDVLEAMPRCASLSVGSLSGYRPARGGSPAAIVVDVEPADGMGRFVQIVGSLSVEATVLKPVGPGAPAGPEVIAASLGPAELRDAYRGGVLGTRYTVELPAPAAVPAGDVVMRVRFSDALTGREHTAELTRPIRPAEAARTAR